MLICYAIYSYKRPFHEGYRLIFLKTIPPPPKPERYRNSQKAAAATSVGDIFHLAEPVPQPRVAGLQVCQVLKVLGRERVVAAV